MPRGYLHDRHCGCGVRALCSGSSRPQCVSHGLFSCPAGSFVSGSRATECTQCTAVRGGGETDPDLWVTMELLDWSGAAQWTNVVDAASVSRCGCSEGYWLSCDSECYECGTGVLCPGMGIVQVQPGFFAPAGNAGDMWEGHGFPGWCPRGDRLSSLASRVSEAARHSEVFEHHSLRARLRSWCSAKCPAGQGHLSFLVSVVLPCPDGCFGCPGHLSDSGPGGSTQVMVSNLWSAKVASTNMSVEVSCGRSQPRMLQRARGP